MLLFGRLDMHYACAPFECFPPTAVYTDENVAGVTFVGNALTNISGDAVYLHCGLNQTVINNLLYDGA